MTNTAAEILTRAKELSTDDRLSVGMCLLKEAAGESVDSLTPNQRSQIESVLLERIDGPFEPWPENWKEEAIALSGENRGE